MKNRKDFVNDLIIWINKNIEMPLKIDDVAIRSGYSKWHLQRLFFLKQGGAWEVLSERKNYVLF
ncbi:MAG: hypothetical protein E6Y75_05740 [Anaerococcus sp.]|nr:hypothetical protein [Anaerococcus sp.]